MTKTVLNGKSNFHVHHVILVNKEDFISVW